MTNEQEMRRELLLIALERCEDPGKALELAGKMEVFIKNGGQAERTLDTDPRQAASSAQFQTVKSPTRRRWADEDDLRLRQLWAEGLSTQEIAEHLQRTPASIGSRRVFLKLDRRKPQRPRSQPPQQASVPAIENRSRSTPKDPRPSGHGHSRKLRDKSKKPAVSSIAKVAKAHSLPNGVAEARHDHAAMFEASVDEVVRFLRSRDYSVVATQDGKYRLDERETLTMEELVARANRVRSQLGQAGFSNVSGSAHRPM
jgi:hypothetical protein